MLDLKAYIIRDWSIVMGSEGPTVNVGIFAQYTFSRISRRVLNARKYDEKINTYRASRINCLKDQSRTISGV